MEASRKTESTGPAQSPVRHRAPRRQTAARTPQQQEAECEICATILAALHAGDGEPVFREFEAPDAFLLSPCKIHLEFFAATLCRNLKPETFKFLQISTRWWSNIAHLRLEDNDNQYDGVFVPLRRRRLPGPSPGVGRLVNSAWISIGLLRRWKDTCHRSHGPNCSSYLGDAQFSSIRPTWLIDVRRQCLVQPSADDEYVALSYVWGDSCVYTTTRQQVEQLQAPYSLAEGKTKKPIAKTVRHAMALAERLGERYLWVDAVCIVQDDEVTKHADIRNMSTIFANASLTLVAAQGRNADSGLLGLRGISGPRSAPQVSHTFGKSSHVLRLHRFDAPDVDTPWNTRAWTFQEDLFSRRKLVFYGDWVRWECREATWTEDSAASRGVSHDRMRTRQVMFSRVLPSLWDLVQTLRFYNTRDLTYPEDALHAFAGIASALRTSFKGGFISGLPADIFFHALLWQPATSISRRKPKLTDSTSFLPSWSWAGWQGELDCWMWDGAGDCVKASSRSGMHGAFYLERVAPLEQWYTLRDTEEKGTAIRNTWYEYRMKYLGSQPEVPCPAGWTRHPTSESAKNSLHYGIPRPGVVPDSFFTHKSQPETEFWYPLPLPDSNEYGDPAQQLVPFIACRTRRGRLLPGEQIPSVESEVISLRDCSGLWLGALHLHDSLEALKDEINGQALELVEVARAYMPYEGNDNSIRLKIPEWECSELPRTGLLYEYYYVMWIEWQGSIAYRKGLGRVEKRAWEAQELEWIDLTLG